MKSDNNLKDKTVYRPETHELNSFAGWSEYLATDPDALQEQLERAKERIKDLETELTLLKSKTQNKVSKI